jgi:hypothetical protein
MNDELEGIWKEVAVALSRYTLRICLKELRKTTNTEVRIAGVLAQIQI